MFSASRTEGICAGNHFSTTLIPTSFLPRVALGPWGSLVYPWWFGTTRLRFKSGRTHIQGRADWELVRQTTATGFCPLMPGPGGLGPFLFLDPSTIAQAVGVE